MSINIEVEGGTSVRLPTAGKYCDRDIVVTATGGGGAEVKTCTVRFVDGGDASSNNYCAYTKFADGVFSAETVGEISSPESGFDITIENVVCGSIIYFPWYYDGDYGEFSVSGSETVTTVPDTQGYSNESGHFVAPSENGAVCTITIRGVFDDGGGMFPW